MWQCHGSPLDKRSWSHLTAKDAVHERSACLINSDSGVGVIRSDLSLQTEKNLSGLSDSSLCMHCGRSHTVWFITYGIRCESISFTMLGILSRAAG